VVFLQAMGLANGDEAVVFERGKHRFNESIGTWFTMVVGRIGGGLAARVPGGSNAGGRGCAECRGGRSDEPAPTHRLG
jgi:hypothetical protein